MKKIGIEIKWGAIITTFYCIWAYIENATGNHKDFSNIIIFGLLFILILILMSIMAFFDKKINFYDGKWDFKQAFRFGLFLTGITAMLNPIAHYIIHNSISPEYFSNLIEYQVAKGRETKEVLVKTYNFDSTMYQNMRDILSFGIVLSTALAYFLKTKNYKSPIKVVELKSKKKK
ncbi:DUF4199 domain-containing protein [Paenimyroides tangerinum]|uniref:DUF4199 domain-containing protein n=1 Tax=Paenimyroides tangerinum TaxID=2488728 RepID=A0A3P3VX51_9FLAO|nr:DUF4199 domain-containing protein [Paenimyroides tangerinum]RRJ87365.1 DUF4199 domain-containing protein [Paenimyroides tangerinum]